MGKKKKKKKKRRNKDCVEAEYSPIPAVSSVR
jgi:hypothetical protein